MSYYELRYPEGVADDGSMTWLQSGGGDHIRMKISHRESDIIEAAVDLSVVVQFDINGDQVELGARFPKELDESLTPVLNMDVSPENLAIEMIYRNAAAVCVSAAASEENAKQIYGRYGREK
jgi:hypothetical protein